MSDENEIGEEDGNKPDILSQHCVQLMEHYDSVLILVTKHDPKTNATAFDWMARGNQFANAGAVEAWQTKEDENTRMWSNINLNQDIGDDDFFDDDNDNL